MNNKRFFTIVLIAGIIIIITVIFRHNSPVSKSDSPNAQVQDAKILEAQKQYAQKLAEAQKVPAINGELVQPDALHRPFGVIVENLPAARPQSGLSQADVVYEALAEGGITRFLALFQTQQPAKIGPVRSARTYFNDWAQEWGAIFAHVGGNSDALAYLKAGIPGVVNADQFFNDPYFWRTAQARPHNTYTSIKNLTAFATAKNVDMQKTYQDFLFNTAAVGTGNAPDANSAPGTGAAQTFNPQQQQNGVPASNISINFSLPDFAVSYAYDQQTDSYKRTLAGQLAVDAGNGARIAPKNIIVQIVRNWPVASDTLFAISMGTREGGNAYVFTGGREIKGTWKFVDGKTRYYDLSGKEIPLTRGQIWIEIVPPEMESSLLVH